MADNLPVPESRVESYLAKAAGEDVTIPEKPLSRLEQYLDAIAEGGGGGGGGSYTAGDGIDITNDTISVDTDTIQEKLTAGTGIDITNNTISATGGGGPTVVQTTGTSTTNVMSQNAVTSMVFGNPGTNTRIKIGTGALVDGEGVSIGKNTRGYSNSVAIGSGAGFGGSGPNEYRTVIGYQAGVNPSSNEKGSISLGAYSKTSATGEMNIGSTDTNYGYNNTNYRLLTGVHDGQDAHDAVTVEQVNATIDAINAALSTSIPHIGAAS